MKKTNVLIIFVFLTTVFFARQASAEWFKAKVTGVDAQAQVFHVSKKDPSTGTDQSIAISVKPETAFTGGLKSASDLSVGDEVSVISQKDENGAVKAISVRKVMIAGAPAGGGGSSSSSASAAAPAAAPVAPPAPPAPGQ